MTDYTASLGPTLPEGKLLEGVVTTLNVDSSPHIAPMGPIVDERLRAAIIAAVSHFGNLPKPKAIWTRRVARHR